MPRSIGRGAKPSAIGPALSIRSPVEVFDQAGFQKSGHLFSVKEPAKIKESKQAFVGEAKNACLEYPERYKDRSECSVFLFRRVLRGGQ